MQKAGKLGQTIIELSKDKAEEDTIRKTLEALESELNQVKNLLNQLRQEIGDSLDAWERFVTLYNIVLAWLTEKKNFLEQPLHFESLPEVKQKLNDYSVRTNSIYSHLRVKSSK